MNEIIIGGHKIGDGHSTFIIAEAGANWVCSDREDLNRKQAFKLVDVASEAGVDAIKFQVYRAEKLYVSSAGEAEYLKKNRSIYEIIRDMEIPYELISELKEYCDKKGIVFLATPFDEESASVLEDAGVEAYKMASYTITHFPLIRTIARFKKPIILSTGASEVADINNALEVIHGEGNNAVALMQCTAKYPASLETINLKVIPDLKKRYDIPVGLSDHSRDPIIASVGAVSLGANIIEKHFTADNSLEGPDHGFAVLPEELKLMVANIRSVEKALGDGLKNIQKEEKELYHFCRRKIYASKDIPKGEVLSKDNIIVLRSGHAEKGLDPSEYDNVMGKRAKTAFKKHDPITREVLDAG
ncbi:N-acetylneuraminate synthase family protein [Candidatus Omnitrophota bacterium]